MKRSVCAELAILFVDLSDIRRKAKYQAGMGTVVSGVDEENTLLSIRVLQDIPGMRELELLQKECWIH